jgi:hypothetical protein
VVLILSKICARLYNLFFLCPRTQVPSGADVRAVGYEDPASHQLNWFNLRKGPLHYVPSIGLYFKLQEI